MAGYFPPVVAFATRAMSTPDGKLLSDHGNSTGNDTPQRARSPTPRKQKQVSEKELEDRFKSMQALKKKDDAEKKEAEKVKKREETSNKKALSLYQRNVGKEFKKKESEVIKLERSLDKVEKDAETKGGREDGKIQKIDDTLEELLDKQARLRAELEEKVHAAAQAKGHLGHVELANQLLLQNNINVPIEMIEGLEGELERDRQEEQAENELRAQVADLKTCRDDWFDANTSIREEIQAVQQEMRLRREKVAIACPGGDFNGATYMNLMSNHIPGIVGPSFSFAATVRPDVLVPRAKLFDFGNGDASDNICAGFLEDSTELSFSVYRGSQCCTLVVDDFWIMGETHDYFLSVSADGKMMAYRDGALMGSRDDGFSPERLVRIFWYIGRSGCDTEPPMRAQITNVKVWHHNVECVQPDRPAGFATVAVNAAEAFIYDTSLKVQPIRTDCLAYPSGVSMNLADLKSTTVALDNNMHRLRMLAEIESGGHIRQALNIFRQRDTLSRGFLAWTGGELLHFVEAVFEHFGLTAPGEDKIFELYSKFDLENSSCLAPRECLCMIDALLRAIFHMEVRRAPIQSGSLSLAYGAPPPAMCPDLCGSSRPSITGYGLQQRAASVSSRLVPPEPLAMVPPHAGYIGRSLDVVPPEPLAVVPPHRGYIGRSLDVVPPDPLGDLFERVNLHRAVPPEPVASALRPARTPPPEPLAGLGARLESHAMQLGQAPVKRTQLIAASAGMPRMATPMTHT